MGGRSVPVLDWPCLWENSTLNELVWVGSVVWQAF